MGGGLSREECDNSCDREIRVYQNSEEKCRLEKNTLNNDIKMCKEEIDEINKKGNDMEEECRQRGKDQERKYRELVDKCSNKTQRAMPINKRVRAVDVVEFEGNKKINNEMIDVQFEGNKKINNRGNAMKKKSTAFLKKLTVCKNIKQARTARRRKFKCYTSTILPIIQFFFKHKKFPAWIERDPFIRQLLDNLIKCNKIKYGLFGMRKAKCFKNLEKRFKVEGFQNNIDDNIDDNSNILIISCILVILLIYSCE